MTDPKPPDKPNTPEAREPEPLTERIADWRPPAAGVDPAAGIVRGVALCGTESRNGYRYPEAVLAAAAPLYEGVPVFLDHAGPDRPGEPRRGRSARDAAGRVTNPHFDRGRLRGDVTTLDTEAGRTFLALAAGDAPGVGMSHVVLAERTPDGAEVTAIREVLSVDAVTFPATVRRLLEGERDRGSQRESETPCPGDKCLSGLRAELAEARAEADRLRGELAGFAAADATVEAAGLPDWAATPAFRRALAAAPTDAARRDLADDRRAVLDRLRVAGPAGRFGSAAVREAVGFPAGPVSRARPAGGGPDRTAALLAAAVRAG